MKKTTSLADLEVMVLDCQATLSDPAKGHLLEMGWGRIRAGASGAIDAFDTTEHIITEAGIESYLAQLPPDAALTPRVRRITGFKTEDLEKGLLPEEIWRKLLDTANDIAAANKRELCPTVIHYARFEEPYLRHLHREYTPAEPFPFQFICTHQVTRRLFPTLPRKGLRAIAGYLGHSVPELRRSAHHTAATAFIWYQVVQLLEEQGIRTLEGLLEWLSTRLSRSKGSTRDYPMPPGARLNLPQKPGVYRMLRSNGDLLYIGKATSLKHRVNSYFHNRKPRGHAEHTLEMLTQASELEVIVTGSALEAALLESDEIKKHAPPYNVALRQRDREIAFFSRDFLQSAPESDENCAIGPLPSINSLAPFAAISELLGPGGTDGSSEDIPLSALGVPPEYAPDPDCFHSGFELFRERHNDILKKLAYHFIFIKNPFQGLMTLGREFHLKWLEELAQKQEEETEILDEDDAADESEEEEVEAPTEWVWTPEAVANSLEHLIRRGAHLVRRARWFCLLSESSLAWDTGKTAGGQRRLLVFRSGSIIHKEDLPEGKEIPFPSGYLRPFYVRQKNFDVMTYDRMRVLTTELRRLVSDKTDRNVQLRLSPTNVLGKESLIKALIWV